MNLIEQVEKILNERVNFKHPFMVSVHQVNDDWFVAEFNIVTVEYKNWFAQLRGKGREYTFFVTVPYLIEALVRAGKTSKEELNNVLLLDIDAFMQTQSHRRIKRNQLRKWGKVHNDTHRKLGIIFRTSWKDDKDAKRHHHREGRGFE